MNGNKKGLHFFSKALSTEMWGFEPLRHLRDLPHFEELRAEYGETQKPYAEVVNMLAHVEVLQHNRQELQRMMENEEHRQVHPAKSRCI